MSWVRSKRYSIITASSRAVGLRHLSANHARLWCLSTSYWTMLPSWLKKWSTRRSASVPKWYRRREVLDMIKDASGVAPYQQKRHRTSAGTSVTEKSKLLLRTLSKRRNALSLKFLQRRHVPPFPSNSKQNLKEIDQPLSPEGQNRTRSEAEPAAPPFDVMQLLA